MVAGHPAVVEIINFASLVFGSTIEIRVAKILNPKIVNPNCPDARIGISLWEDDIISHHRMYKEYDYFDLFMDLYDEALLQIKVETEIDHSHQ